MRRMWIVGIGLGLLVLAVGCQGGGLCRRGALFAPTAAVPPAAMPTTVIQCPPVDPCCGVPVVSGACDPCMSTTTVIPPTSTFVPGPAG